MIIMNVHIIDKEVDISLINAYISNTHTLYAYWSNINKETIDCLIIRSQAKITEKILDLYPKVACICRVWVWLEKVDLDACKKRWIKVINRAWANADAVAELAIRAILDGARKPRNSYNDLQQDISGDRTWYIWKELKELTLWFFGMWNVGKATAKKLSWFGITDAVYVDPFVTWEIHWVRKCSDIETLCKVSDIVVIVAPLFETTRYTINTSTLSLCKPTVRICNMSRWGLVDESALMAFLEKNTQASFFADVREDEPEITSSLKNLLRLPNYMITNHIWSWTTSAIEAMHYFDILA